MLSNPYYRIYRPFSKTAMIQNAGLLYYAEDDCYCNERIQLIRMYKMLQTQVIDTFQYVEPVPDNENVYSLRYHQLYGNICSEIETNFRGILKANGYTRGSERNWNIKDDFFKTNLAIKLNEYVLKSYNYELLNSASVNRPFANWDTTTYSPLSWYQEHNAVKHYRSSEFKNADLKNVLTALTGLYILLFAQFGFLVDTITNNGVMSVFDENDEHIPIVKNNELGYDFNQTPTWSDHEKYGFEWNIIKGNSSPFINHLF